MKYNKVRSICDIHDIFRSPCEQNLHCLVENVSFSSPFYVDVIYECPLAATALHPLPHGLPLGGLLRHGRHRADYLVSDHMSQGERKAL